jgi:hypothetical protein
LTDFEQMAPAALALAGLPVGEGDLEVLAVVAQAFDPAMQALDGADLAQLPVEGDLDPGRAPTAAAPS